jgi:hypothetical protein
MKVAEYLHISKYTGLLNIYTENVNSYRNLPYCNITENGQDQKPTR